MSRLLMAMYLACAASFALGLLPIMAQGAPVMTHPTGTILSVGTPIRGTNIGETKMTSSIGNVTCSTAVLNGAVTANSTAGGAKMNITSASFTGTGSEGECTSWTGGITGTFGIAGGLPWCIEATAASDIWKLRGGKCSELSRGIKFAWDFTSIGTCVYNRATAAEGTITTDPENAVIHLVSQEWLKIEGGAFCPSSTALDTTFRLETDMPTNEPVYFSS